LGNSEIIYCPHEYLLQILKKDDRILIYDGIMEVKVLEKISDTVVLTEVIRGGVLEPYKGLNLPTVKLHFNDIEEKDKKDALFILANNFDYAAIYFVQSAHDVALLKKIF